MRFHQQPSKQYVCQKKKKKKFVILEIIYFLHNRLVMMSQLMWISPNFGQVSNLMWIFQLERQIVWCLTLCGFYDVHSNDRKTPKDCPDTFYSMLRGLTDLALKPKYTAVPASLTRIVCMDEGMDRWNMT